MIYRKNISQGTSWKSGEIVFSHRHQQRVDLSPTKSHKKRKDFLFGGPQSPFSISSSCIVFFVSLPFFLKTKSILLMQISAPFCFDPWLPSWKKFCCCETSRPSQCLLMVLCRYPNGRWMIFFIFVDFWLFLSLARGLYAYNINIWSLCEGKHRLKLIRGLSVPQPAPQTSMMLPTLLRSAAQRTIERWRERCRSIRTNCLPPEADRKGWFLWAWLFQ